MDGVVCVGVNSSEAEALSTSGVNLRAAARMQISEVLFGGASASNVDQASELDSGMQMPPAVATRGTGVKNPCSQKSFHMLASNQKVQTCDLQHEKNKSY